MFLDTIEFEDDDEHDEDEEEDIGEEGVDVEVVDHVERAEDEEKGTESMWRCQTCFAIIMYHYHDNHVVVKDGIGSGNMSGGYMYSET